MPVYIFYKALDSFYTPVYSFYTGLDSFHTPVQKRQDSCVLRSSGSPSPATA